MNHYKTTFDLFIDEIKQQAAAGRRAITQGLPNAYPDATKAVEIHEKMKRSLSGKKIKVPTIGDIYLALFFTANPTDKETRAHMNLLAYADTNYPHDEITAQKSEQYEKAIRSSNSLTSRLLNRDESRAVAQCASAYFMPFLDGCRGYLEQQRPLRDLRFVLQDSDDNAERGAQITNCIIATISLSGEFRTFSQAYDALSIKLDHMPMHPGELEIAFADSYNSSIISGKIESCKKLFLDFNNRNCQVVSTMRKQARAFGNVTYTPLAPEQTPDVRGIMSEMSSTVCSPTEPLTKVNNSLQK